MVFCIIVITVIALLLVYALFYVRNVKKNGLEAVAEVSRVEVSEHFDSDTGTSTSLSYYVTYQDSDGNTVEAGLVNPLAAEMANRKRNHKKEIEVGQKMKVKYLPGKVNAPVFVEYL